MRQVLDRIRNDGLAPTMELVFAKLDEPMPLGYCNVGRVLEVGEGVVGFHPGDLVVSNGRHAEVVNISTNLCAKTPSGLDPELATFTVLSSIGLQGIRLLKPQIGERIAVFGLGLIGLVAVQMLVNSGAHVLGIDVDPRRLELAQRFGATPVDVKAGADPVAAGMAFSSGHGVDGVLITASAKDDRIISQSAQMSRKRGRIVLVGVVNMLLNRAEFYEKELSFQVSCSYGPGRYDPKYEDEGIDYPFPFVRWTEQRNLEAILDLLAADRLDVSSLITSRVPHAEAARAYDMLANDRSQLGILLKYPDAEPPLAASVKAPALRKAKSPSVPQCKVGVIGAGSYTKIRLLPELKRSGAQLVSIASATGVTATLAARKYGFATSTTDYRTILENDDINTVFITTRHNQHVPMAVAALAAGKHVFVEKPAAIDPEGLAELRAAYEESEGLQLLVGFNRRFSAHAEKIRQLLATRSQPVCMNMMVNAGNIPADHWVQDPRVGGGRIIGEGCHWVDLLRFCVNSPIVAVQAVTVGESPGQDTTDDKMTISLRFADGSLGNVHYFANGSKAFVKERLEVHSEGRTLVLDNFKSLVGYGWSNFRKLNFWSQDKGRAGEIGGFVRRVAAGGEPMMPAAEIWNVTEATFAATEAAKNGSVVTLSADAFVSADAAVSANESLSEC